MSGLVTDVLQIAQLGSTGLAVPADAYDVTALAASRFGLPTTAKAWKGAPETKRSSAWSEPEPWIVAVLLATGVAVIARHPIARAIGTEADDTTMTPSVVATAGPAPSTAPSTRAGAVAPVPTHAPRNPFSALVDASGAIVAPEAVAAVTARAAQAAVEPASPVAHQPKSVAAAASSCAGTVHTVVAGDTLWSLAARMVKSGDTGRITVVWHRIYKANTPPLGSNPSLLPVGTKLCLPSNG